MARMHGQDARAYWGVRDISADAGQIDIEATADTHERTTFNDGGWKAFDAGLGAWSASIQGFYQPGAAASTFGGQAEGLLGSATANAAVLSVYDGDADAIGDAGVLLGDATVSNLSRPVAVGDLIAQTVALTGTGRPGLHGRLLHALGAETATGSGTGYDNAASSANGGRGSVHITAITGTWTLKIQHSTDNSSWSDLITFTAATAVGAQTSEVTGTVNRYLRADFTEDSAGSCTFVMGFARY